MSFFKQSVMAATIIGVFSSSLLYAEAPVEQGKSMKSIFQKLNLTKAQKRELRDSRQNMRQQIKSQKAKRPKISHFITEKGVDRTNMLKVATKRTVILTNLRVDMLEKTLKILSPDQRKKFISLLKSQ